MQQKRRNHLALHFILSYLGFVFNLVPEESFAAKCTFTINFRSQVKLWHRIDLVDDYCQQFLSILLYISGSSQIFKMLVKTFENIEKNISKNIVKLNLKQKNLYCIIIWSTYGQRKHLWQACQARLRIHFERVHS